MIYIGIFAAVVTLIVIGAIADSKEKRRLFCEVGRLLEQNENLRLSLAVLKEKPGRSELRSLYVYEKAIQLMLEKAPESSSALISAIREAEAEMEKINTGRLAWIRRMIISIPSVSKAGLRNDSDKQAIA